MGMTRNIQRYGWIIPYLFGTSPAICKSFLAGAPNRKAMKEFNKNTYLRKMGHFIAHG